MTAGHSDLAPSSAARWVVCNGSVQLIRDLPPEEESIEAREGNAAHEVGAALLRLGVLMDVGDPTSNGVSVTQEMVEMATVLAEHVAARLPPGQWATHLHVEERIAIPRIHELCWGTPDVWALLLPGMIGTEDGFFHLHLWDGKFGHLFVPHVENWQCIAYVLGVLDRIASFAPDTHVKVHIHIVQPRAYHREGPIRTWEVMASDLRAHANILTDAAHRAISGPAHLQTNDECEYCPARHVCTPAQTRAYRAADMSRDVTPHHLTPAQAGIELKWLREARDSLDARISGLEVQVETAMRAGAFVPHWELSTRAGNLEWVATHDEIRALGELNGVDLFNRPAPITPTQAKQRFKALEPMIDSYASRGPGRTKLMPLDLTKAKEIFSHGK